jgi:NAD(P)H-hydrate epimerase
MGRLAKLETAAVQADRWGIARAKAQEWNVILVLKGAHTLVAEPGGRIAVLPVKTDALATAGTGDVLAGLITGLRAGHIDAFEAAVAGSYLHGLAGLLAAKRVGSSRSVIAGDVLAALPGAFAALRS